MQHHEDLLVDESEEMHFRGFFFFFLGVALLSSSSRDEENPKNEKLDLFLFSFLVSLTLSRFSFLFSLTLPRYSQLRRHRRLIKNSASFVACERRKNRYRFALLPRENEEEGKK